MNFNFKEILEMFNGHWRFIVVSLMIGVAGGYFVIVPIAKSFLESDNYNCSEVLDENMKLVSRVVEISAVLREYSKLQEAQKSMNRSVSQMVIESAIEEDSVAPPPSIQIVDHANRQLNKEKELLIEKAKVLTNIDP